MTDEDLERLVREFVWALHHDGHAILGTTVHGRVHCYVIGKQAAPWIEARFG